MTLRLAAAVLMTFPVCAAAAMASELAQPVPPRIFGAGPTTSPPTGIIRQIEFQGLRRIPAATLRARISSQEGQMLEPRRVEEDVRALNRFGWFDTVAAEVHPIDVAGAVPDLRLVYVFEERPLLAEVKFRGSRALPREQIATVLAARDISLKIAAPASRVTLWRAARAIEAELADLGYPKAKVSLHLERVPTLAVRADFEIHDGPKIEVTRVSFSGNRAFRDEQLRREMKRIAPHAVWAGLREKRIYTLERLAEDLERLESFYRNHGYPEARLGTPRVEIVQRQKARWTRFLPLPFPRRAKRQGSYHPSFDISIPVEEGVFYRLAGVELPGRPESSAPESGKPAAMASGQADKSPALRDLKPGVPYSEEKLLQAREELAHFFGREGAVGEGLRREVEVVPHLDRVTGTARVTFRTREIEPYTVRRIEFLGHRRFSDRFFRRRILIQEGKPFDPERLERGLAQLASTGFIRPVESRDVHVRLDETLRSADITIRFQEIGRRRISFVGGGSHLVNTFGLMYQVFDLLGGEELLTAHLEGGPESLNLLFSLTKEGLLGTKTSFGLSVFHNVFRPRLQGLTTGQRLFTSRSSGLGLGWTYPVTSRDALGVNYELAQTSTQFHLSTLENAGGASAEPLRLAESRRAVGLAWAHSDGHQRLDLAASVSGGQLGGDEKLLHSSLEYSRLEPDPLTGGRNRWAMRGYLAGVSAYGGSALPLHKRLFAGDQFVRGFRTGELAPYAVWQTQTAEGTSRSSGTQTAGANLLAVFNGEYRVPLERRTEAAGFFDAGGGWLLPNWLGNTRPEVVSGTNGLVRASTGVELRFEMPVVNQPLRFYYAVNPLRLASRILLPDGSRFQPPDRRAAFGWALGSLF
jgi:outer membrane protein insertion porin family